jgi:hypothetical protein
MRKKYKKGGVKKYQSGGTQRYSQGRGYGDAMSNLDKTLETHSWYFNDDNKKNAFKQAVTREGSQKEVLDFQNAYNSEMMRRAKESGMSDDEINQMINQTGFTNQGSQKLDGKFGNFTSTRPMYEYPPRITQPNISEDFTTAPPPTVKPNLFKVEYEGVDMQGNNRYFKDRVDANIDSRLENQESLTEEQVKELQRRADINNAEIEKKYNNPDAKKNPKAQERYNRLKQTLKVTPEYEDGGETDPIRTGKFDPAYNRSLVPKYTNNRFNSWLKGDNSQQQPKVDAPKSSTPGNELWSSPQTTYGQGVPTLGELPNPYAPQQPFGEINSMGNLNPMGWSTTQPSGAILRTNTPQQIGTTAPTIDENDPWLEEQYDAQRKADTEANRADLNKNLNNLDANTAQLLDNRRQSDVDNEVFGSNLKENTEAVEKRQPYQFFNPYSGFDIPTAASMLGSSIENKNAFGIVTSGAKLATGLGRNILGGMGQQRVENRVMKNYYDNQRDVVTQANRPRAFQEGGQMNQEEQMMQEVAQMLQQGAQPEEVMQALMQQGMSQEQAMALIQAVMQSQQSMMQEEQIMQMVAQALQQGTPPEQILQELISNGIPEEQAMQILEMVMQQMQPPQEEQPMMKNGGEYLEMMKGKKIKNYTFNKDTNSYEVEFE